MFRNLLFKGIPVLVLLYFHDILSCFWASSFAVTVIVANVSQMLVSEAESWNSEAESWKTEYYTLRRELLSAKLEIRCLNAENAKLEEECSSLRWALTEEASPTDLWDVPSIPIGRGIPVDWMLHGVRDNQVVVI